MTSPPTILIADDETVFCYATARLLETDGFRCVCVHNAEEARKELQKGAYDLLIADIRMPGNPNLEFVREVAEVAPGLPVVIVTGYPSVPTAMQSVNLNVAAYLTKPFDLDVLLEKVRGAVASFRTIQTARDAYGCVERAANNLRKLLEAAEVCGSGCEQRNDAIVAWAYDNLRTAFRLLHEILEARYLGREPLELPPIHTYPPLKEAVEALRETARVLEETKSSFKSKQLGRLRTRIEEVLSSLDR